MPDAVLVSNLETGKNQLSAKPNVINWPDFDTVLFDMDGTLLDLHYDNHFWIEHLPRRYADLHAVPHAEAQADLVARFAAKRGQLDWYCVDYWSRELRLDIEALKHETAERIALRPGALTLLRWLKHAGKRRLLLTNAHPKALAIKLAHTRLDQHLDGILSSHQYGYPKERDEFWQAFVAEHPVNLERCVFIDDSLDVLRAARRNGVGAVMAIPNPDSQRAAHDTAEFTALPDLLRLIPADAHDVPAGGHDAAFAG